MRKEAEKKLMFEEGKWLVKCMSNNVRVPSSRVVDSSRCLCSVSALFVYLRGCTRSRRIMRHVLCTFADVMLIFCESSSSLALLLFCPWTLPWMVSSRYFFCIFNFANRWCEKGFRVVFVPFCWVWFEISARWCDGSGVGEPSWRRTKNESMRNNKYHTKRNLNSDDWIIEPIRWYIVQLHAISYARSQWNKKNKNNCMPQTRDEVNRREFGFFRRCSESAAKMFVRLMPQYLIQQSTMHAQRRPNTRTFDSGQTIRQSDFE